MEYLHAHNIVHRDLNLKNVLVADDWSCKVADFGLSLFTSGRTVSISNAGKGTLMYTVCMGIYIHIYKIHRHMYVCILCKCRGVGILTDTYIWSSLGL